MLPAGSGGGTTKWRDHDMTVSEAVSISEDAAINSVAERVARGECILFLGAGVHAPPPPGSPYQDSYPEGVRPALGRAFSEHLAAKCSYASTFPKDTVHNLQRVSLCYELDNSRQQLVTEIRDAVHTDKKPSPVLRALAQLDFPLVITTNYDKLFERALAAQDKQPRVRVYSKDEDQKTDDIPNPTASEPFVFKLHGDIDTPESIVITDEDYIHFVLRMSDREAYHPVPFTFRYRFANWPTLFLGYSLLDYNLRLLFKTLRWKTDVANVPDTYSVDPYPDSLIVKVWSGEQKYVKFIAQDVWTYVPKLYARVKGQEMAV
jgi:hypothetical protein